MKRLTFILIINIITANILNLNISLAETPQSLLPEQGRFNAYIVIPERPTEIERFAAGELAKYTEKITGVEIAIIKEKPDLKYFGFYIGSTKKGFPFIPPKILLKSSPPIITKPFGTDLILKPFAPS